MTDMQWFAEQFEANRPRLRAVAYRMLGSVTEAEDALQEAWIRSIRTDSATISNIGGWLTTVVGRVSIDMLRARQSRRENLTGTWLPEPVVSADGALDPEQSSLLADSVGLALLVVLESLEPAERVAFVLHDMFGVPYDEIAPIVDRGPEATRQLASRARRRVRGTAAAPNADPATQRTMVAAFLAASRSGDFEELIRLLDPDVVFRVDTGSRSSLGPPLLTGADDVARHASAYGPKFATLCHLAVVNGMPGIVARTRSGVAAVAGFTVVDERIVEIDLVLDQDKLATVTISA